MAQSPVTARGVAITRDDIARGIDFRSHLDGLPGGDPLRAVTDDAAALATHLNAMGQARCDFVQTIDTLRDKGISWENIGRIIDVDGRSLRSWRTSWTADRWPNL